MNNCLCQQGQLNDPLWAQQCSQPAASKIARQFEDEKIGYKLFVRNNGKLISQRHEAALFA